MDVNLVKALLYIGKYCVSQTDCKTYAFAPFCGKLPNEWQEPTLSRRVEILLS